MNIIRDRRDDMILAFGRALDEAERCLDYNQDSVAFAGVPKFTAHVTFTFPSGTTVETIPEFYLDDDVPPGVQIEELPVLGPWESHPEFVGVECRRNVKTGKVMLTLCGEGSESIPKNWIWDVLGKGIVGYDPDKEVSRTAVDTAARGLGYQLQ